MPTYISLVNLTEQGIKEVKMAPERLQTFDVAAREAGGKLVGFYLVMGQYDYIVITEAPDDQIAARSDTGDNRARECPHTDNESVSPRRIRGDCARFSLRESGS